LVPWLLLGWWRPVLTRGIYGHWKDSVSYRWWMWKVSSAMRRN